MVSREKPTLVLAALLLAGGVAAGEIHDPTAPPPAAAAGASVGDADAEAPQIHAIMGGASERRAVTDGGVLAAGDEIPFGRVKRIERSAVIFSRRGEEVRVTTVESIRR